MISSGFSAKPCWQLYRPTTMSMSPHLVPCLISSTAHDATPYAGFPAPLLSRLSQIIDNKKDTNNEET